MNSLQILLTTLVCFTLFVSSQGDCNQSLTNALQLQNTMQNILATNFLINTTMGIVDQNMTVYACEYKNVIFYCPPGSYIYVNYADYGRLTKAVCPHPDPRLYGTLHCSRNDLYTQWTLRDKVLPLDFVQKQCNNQTVCAPWPNYLVMGDPCVGTTKYMTIQFKCISGNQGSATSTSL